MSNDELDRRLRNSPVPERSADYWVDFPRIVLRRLGDVSRRDDAGVSPFAFPRWLVVTGLAVVCCLLALSAWVGNAAGRKQAVSNADLEALRGLFAEVARLFPGQLRAVELSANGGRVLLTESASSNGKVPLLLRVCADGECRSIGTFSGEVVTIHGAQFEVLASGSGDVLLVGDSIVLSTSPGATRVAGWSLVGKVLHAI